MRQSSSNAHPFVLLDRAFALIAILAALGTEIGGTMMQSGWSQGDIDAAAAIVLVACSLVGMHARNTLSEYHRGEIARVYNATRNGVRDGSLDRRDVSSLEQVSAGFRSMLEYSWRALTRRDGLAQWSYDINRGLTAKRGQSQTLAALMGEDARVIAAAAKASQSLESAIGDQLGPMRAQVTAAATATQGVATEASALAAAVRAVTSQTEKASAIAIRMAEAAFATQAHIGRISDCSTTMLKSADAVGNVLRAAEEVAMKAGLEAASAGEDGRAGADGRGLAASAAEIKTLAQTGISAIESMLATVRELKTQTAQAFMRVQDLTDVVQAQNEFGHALSHAAMVQADVVGRVMSQLGAALGEVKALQAGVDGISWPDTRLGSNLPAQRAVERLPGYAESMAQILRGLPDFNQNEIRTRASSQPQAPAEH